MLTNLQKMACLENYQRYGADRMVCPACSGGSSRERSMSVWEINDGIYATCHRASCTAGTTQLLSHNHVTSDTPKDIKPKRSYGRDEWVKTKVFFGNGLSSPITYEENDAEVVNDYLQGYAAFRDNANDVPRKFIVGHDDGNIYLPMYDAAGKERGVIVKPDTSTGPKSLTYTYDSDYDGMSWYLRPDHMARPEIYVVEDGLSAIALYMAGVDAVSLNGTLLNDGRIWSLLNSKHVAHLCLDADATGKALYYANRYRTSCNIGVRRLVRDIKDMTMKEVRNFLERELSN